MGDERRINQLTAKAYDNIGSSDYFAVDNASEAESKKLPASSIKTPISNLQGEVTGGSDTYSSTKNYSVGMYATHTTGGVQKLYRCKTACTAASWTTNASCFEEANLADAVSALNNDLVHKRYEQYTTTSSSLITIQPSAGRRIINVVGHSIWVEKMEVSNTTTGEIKCHITTMDGTPVGANNTSWYDIFESTLIN